MFAERFGRPGRRNDKGKIEGLVGYARLNFLVPVPRFASWQELNAQLIEKCRKPRERRLRGHEQKIGERFQKDAKGLLPLAPVRYEACEKCTMRVTWPSLGRDRNNDHSMPTAYGHRRRSPASGCPGEKSLYH